EPPSSKAGGTRQEILASRQPRRRGELRTAWAENGREPAMWIRQFGFFWQQEPFISDRWKPSVNKAILTRFCRQAWLFGDIVTCRMASRKSKADRRDFRSRKGTNRMIANNAALDQMLLANYDRLLRRCRRLVAAMGYDPEEIVHGAYLRSRRGY